jgi:predicted Zn-dependent protease with MMP-like domain
MKPEEVETVIDETLDTLPKRVTGAIADVQIYVAKSRSDTKTLREAVTKSGLQRVTVPQDFRALFMGEPLAASEGDDEEADPVVGVIVFNAAMLRDSEDVVFTLLHEIGHALGLDEDEVAALGLE